MKHLTKESNTPARGNEKFLLLLVMIVGLGGLLLTFKSTPTEQSLEIEGIQLESRVISSSASTEAQEDYVLR